VLSQLLGTRFGGRRSGFAVISGRQPPRRTGSDNDPERSHRQPPTAVVAAAGHKKGPGYNSKGHCPRCPHVSDDERHLLHEPASLKPATAIWLGRRYAPPSSRRKAPNSRSAPCKGWVNSSPKQDSFSVSAGRLLWNGHRLRRWNRGARRDRRQRSIDRKMIMERHLSTGVATIVALMAATRTTSGRLDIPFDPTEDADFSAEHVAPRDQVGDWLLSLARRRALTGGKASRRKSG
jgi:hypothetical protein